MVKFKQVFRRLRDPRAANASHPLLEVLFIALAAVLCGAQGFSDMAQFGRAKEGVLRTILPLDHGIPSHDTFNRLFRALDPEHFQAVFRHFVAAFAKANNVDLTGIIAIDGKAVRGAYQRGQNATPLHLVNVFASQARLALASRQAPGRNEAQGAIVRSHWAIENQLHWVLDVVFNEDASRVRKDNAPENFATLRQIAFNLMRAHPAKLSMRQKIKTAGWNDAFLLNLISHMR